MIGGENIIGYKHSAQGISTFFSENAETWKPLACEFYEATSEEIDEAMDLAEEASAKYAAISSKNRAKFLRAIASEILNLGDLLIQRCKDETGLKIDRLYAERKRTIFQLENFAELLEEGSWVEASIDAPNGEIVTSAVDLRKLLHPVGPVVVFTASNFPMAYSTAGVDTASALAAGCPVIVKNHPSHAGAGELVAHAIVRAAKRTEMPNGVFSLVHGKSFDVGRQLVLHKHTKSVAFTGSFTGGKALYDMAQSRLVPIPVFSEMGSINPIVLLPQALTIDTELLADNICKSLLLSVGQFCTNPGLLIAVECEALSAFEGCLKGNIQKAKQETMLHQGILKSYYSIKDELLAVEGVRNLISTNVDETNKVQAAIAIVDAEDFLKSKVLQTEVFGPFSLLVKCRSKNDLYTVLSSLEGQLTGTIHAQNDDLIAFPKVRDILMRKVGRLIFNGVPTGVEVCKSMHHGGPFPATTDSRFSSVGADAIKRFCRPIAFQNSPQQYLPIELRDENELGIWRCVNNKFTKNSVNG